MWSRLHMGWSAMRSGGVSTKVSSMAGSRVNPGLSSIGLLEISAHSCNVVLPTKNDLGAGGDGVGKGTGSGIGDGGGVGLLRGSVSKGWDELGVRLARDGPA